MTATETADYTARAAHILKKATPEVISYIQECTGIAELVHIRNLARDLANDAAESKLRAMRDAGALLLEHRAHMRPLREWLGVTTNSKAQSLATRLEYMAKVPSAKFEEAIAKERRKRDPEISTHTVRMLIANVRREEKIAKIAAKAAAAPRVSIPPAFLNWSYARESGA